MTTPQEERRLFHIKQDLPATFGAAVRTGSLEEVYAIGSRMMTQLNLQHLGSFTDLLGKYFDHGYTPTIRCYRHGQRGMLHAEKILADCYDFAMAYRGSPARVYRG